MSYTITVSHKDREIESQVVGTLPQARTAAEEIVNEAADGFSDDRDVLKQYGYTAAQDWAIDLSDQGGECTLADGTNIEVVNNNINKEDK